MDNLPPFSPNRYPLDEGTAGMKAFFLVVLFFSFFLLIASSSLAQVDLTPDTPPANTSQTDLSDQQAEVIMIQDSSPSTALEADTQPAIPVTGSCTNPYTVRDGDTLSLIAEMCGTTLGAIRLANPQITNINLIYAGQQLVIPTTSAGDDNPVPVTSDSKLVIIPTNTPAPTQTPAAIIPSTGNTNQATVTQIVEGTLLQITVRNFPANTPLNIYLQEQGGLTTLFAVGATSLDGSLTTSATLPQTTNPETIYTITVSTASGPLVQAVSDPFTIAPSTGN
jgi:LysM repeat protein